MVIPASNVNYPPNPDIEIYPEDFWEELRSHRIVSVEGKKQRICQYCRSKGVRYESGSIIITRHKCETCQVPLCKGRKNCFVKFHWEFRNLTKMKQV
ncbi:hypothetical protein FSP39_017224 [Pinctada imbricata]|uniref:PiggyBac transposable element-derived protein 4 C-terminal zinc-finger domain-containing protein n=1 Tax=Pinctada imbricata TaxID=66713 RepID=A0AA88YD98_PINIB|nr:hypothetical protein FSP39_017224 [Pinctada imbricata]